MSNPVTTVRFASPKHRELRLLRKCAEERLGPNGSLHTIAPEVTYEFHAGHLEIGRNRDLIADKWDGTQMVEQDAVEWIMSHPEIGQRFHLVEEVAPDPGSLYAEIANAVIAGDVDKLRAIGADEQETWNRPEVMDMLTAAVTKLDPAVLEDMAAQPQKAKT